MFDTLTTQVTMYFTRPVNQAINRRDQQVKYLVGQPCLKDSIYLSLLAPGHIPRCGLLWKKCVFVCLPV